MSAARQVDASQAATLLRAMGEQARHRLRDSVSPSARVMYVVGLLIADDKGRVHDTDLEAALKAPGVVDTARALAEEWGLL